jgi:hypothetical protein
MSLRPSDSDRIEKILESTRRDVRQLEIDAARIRTDLAQLEAVNAVGVLDGEVAPVLDEDPIETSAPPAAPSAVPATPSALDWQPAAAVVPDGMEILVGVEPQSDESSPIEDSVDPEPITTDVPGTETPAVAEPVTLARALYRRLTSPMVASLTVHTAILVLTLSISVAAIERDSQFGPTVLSLGDKPVKEPEHIDVQQLADLGQTSTQSVTSETSPLDLAGSTSIGPPAIPVDVRPLDGPAALSQMGIPSALTTDLGALMTGVGGTSTNGNVPPGGSGAGGSGGHRAAEQGARKSDRRDATLFFGTEARGNRFVFVVDNSASMKGGRLEMAEAELIKTVNGLSPRQSFYVIFVSDQPYPMFYPQREPDLVPATPANKKRLADWVPKAILASGKNRELITAMDLAASLRPQAVYLLWDGDMKYSDKVRMDVMTHLTQPNTGWKFIVHTLGMGITSLDSEQNLTLIARAHGGVYRRVDIPNLHKR